MHSSEHGKKLSIKCWDLFIRQKIERKIPQKANYLHLQYMHEAIDRNKKEKGKKIDRKRLKKGY